MKTIIKPKKCEVTAILFHTRHSVRLKLREGDNEMELILEDKEGFQLLESLRIHLSSAFGSNG